MKRTFFTEGARAPSGAQRPGCRRGDRYAEGCREYPYLKKIIGFVVFGFLVSKILGFLVSRIFGFLVSKILGFLVSKILGFLVSRILGFLVSEIQEPLMFLKDVLSILPNYHFMFFDKY